MPVFVIDGEQELVIASGLSIDTKKKEGGGKERCIEGSASMMKVLNIAIVFIGLNS